MMIHGNGARFLALAGLLTVTAGCGGSPTVGEPDLADPAAALDLSQPQGGCPMGQLSCGGACVDPLTDSRNCGGCGMACPMGSACGNGMCEGPMMCMGGQTRCANGCVDLQNDPNNCGACGKVCDGGAPCFFGTCPTGGCPPGLLECGFDCVDPTNDPSNCGGCDKACAMGQACQNAKCACDQGLTNCNGACTDTANDAANCGACGKTCAQGEVCSAGACKGDCMVGQTKCGFGCYDLKTNNFHCGKCNSPCALGLSCMGGVCDCKTGTNCGGACVDLKVNVNNCGKCGVKCGNGQSCTNGVCGCPMGTTPCNGGCANFNTDPKNCGGCGKACANGQGCANGACGCPMGTMVCGGACVNVGTDVKNCGMCGTVCPMGQVCAAGKCGCPMGTMICNGACANLNTDVKNCGKCGTVCGMNQVCAAGVCTVSCGLLTNCSGACVDLKTDLQNCGKCGNAINPLIDPLHCGGCGKPCAAPANATAGCAMGLCGIGMCRAGFNDCDKDPKTGCESSSQTDAKNCGSCGKVCGPTDACCAGGCKNVMLDPMNCGACGNACGNGTACCGGACLDPKFLTLMSVDCTKPFKLDSTSNAEFTNKGKLDQLVVDMTGASTLPANMAPPPAQAPYVWIAMHDSNQVNRIDAKTGALAGLYSSRGTNPSRLAVALDGSVWVGNRCPNDPNNGDCSNLAQILPDGTPGCTIKKAADGKSLPFVRGVAIDAAGYVWFSSWNDRRIHKVDPAKCTVLYDLELTAGGTTSAAYGLAIDRKGLMWNSALDQPSVMAVDTTVSPPVIKYAVPVSGKQSYGVVIDRKNNAYFAQWAGTTNGGVFRIDPATLDNAKVLQAAGAMTVISGMGNGAQTRGLTIDTDGNLWAATWKQPSATTRVNKFEGGTGKFLATFNIAGVSSGVGIAGDTYGKVWLPGYDNEGVVRFDAKTGAVDFTKTLMGKRAYTYSDWNSISLKTVTSNNAQAGTWTREIDSGSAKTVWATATWVANTPKGTSVAVYFKAGANQADFVNQKSCGPFYTQPVDLTACMFGMKQWLQVSVVLNTNDVNVRPTLSNLKVYYQ